MIHFEKERISISRKILLIFISVLLIQLFLFTIALSLATKNLVRDITFLRIDTYLKNAELLDSGDEKNDFLQEISSQYIETVIINVVEDGEDKITYSKGLGKLISEEQLKTVINNAYQYSKTNEIYHEEIITVQDQIYYGALLTNNNTIVVGISSDNYLNSSIFSLILVVVSVYTLIFFIGAAIILFWAHSVTERLNTLCNFVVDMPKDEYKKAFIDDGDDEIYTLSIKIDEMRRTILNDSAARHAMIQNVSHDLKTPIAVIKSYAEAIEDGIEDVSSTSVIINQCNKLEKKVKRFIEFNKLEYLNVESFSNQILMQDVILELISNCKYLTDIEIETDLDDTVFYGRYENYYVICENILENAIRYAKKEIKITLKDGELSFYNDGKPISEQFIKQGFKPYEKGSDGKFGLGMSIVCRTLDIFDMKLEVKNCKKGVLFVIKSK